MKKLLTFLALILLFSCSKEEIQKNAVMQAMTTGVWRVTSFVDNGTDVTTDFTGYLFFFKENQTVDAYSNGSLEKTGTWSADATAKTITSNFSNAPANLTLFNGTWVINDSGWDFVKATLDIGGSVRTLRLQKN
jgi:hypothetical protein